MRENRAASFIDVTMHQAARREALAAEEAKEKEPMTLNEFLWTLFGMFVVLIGILWAIKP